MIILLTTYLRYGRIDGYRARIRRILQNQNIEY